MNIYDFPQVSEALGIDPAKLGCVMLRLHASRLSVGEGQDIQPEWLYSDPNCPPWMQGIPDPHVTLLYGLLQPASAYWDQIREVMSGWVPPHFMTANQYRAFGPSEASYRAIVAVLENEALQDAHDRLSLLPHCDTFSLYEPHVTLAYVRSQYANDALRQLNGFQNPLNNWPPIETAFIPDMSHGLDLGDER